MADVQAQVVTEFKATGVEEVRRGLRLVSDEAGHAGEVNEKLARGARAVASGLEEVARTGEAGGRSLKEMVAGVAELAVNFGVGGPLTIALGIGALAVFRYFQHAREQMDETTRKFRTDLAELARAADLVGLSKKMGELHSGDPFADLEGRRKDESEADFRARRLGIQGIQARIAAINANANVQAFEAAAQPGFDPLKRNALYTSDIAKATMQLMQERTELQRQLPDLIAKENQYLAVEQRIVAVVKERAASALSIARDAKAGQLPSEAPMGFSDEWLKRIKDAVPVIGQIGDASKSMAAQLNDEIDALVVEARAATTTAERRLAIEERIVAIMKEQETLAAKTQPGAIAIPKVIADPKGLGVELARLWESLGEQAARSFVSTLAGGIREGIIAVVRGGGIGGGFTALGKAVLSGLGSIFEQIGETALLGMAFMAKIKAAILSFAPEIGIPIAIGLIAFGAALQGLGAGAGGGGGGYGGGSYSSSLPSIIDRGTIDPSGINRAAAVSPRTPQTFQFTVIGENDPRAQRSIVRLIQNAGQRNL